MRTKMSKKRKRTRRQGALACAYVAAPTTHREPRFRDRRVADAARVAGVACGVDWTRGARADRGVAVGAKEA